MPSLPPIAAELDSLAARSREYVQYFHHCVFKPPDWERAGIDVAALRDFCIGETETARTIVFHRSVVLADIQGEVPRFFSKQDCPVTAVNILDDYHSELGRSVDLRRLIQLLRQMGPPAVMSAPTLRILVEAIYRGTEAKNPLPPHEDGRACLFFLVLQNSMIGGDLKLFRSFEKLNLIPIRTKINETPFYAEEDLEFLTEMPCEAGYGYFIHEHHSSGLPAVLHACAAWAKPPDRHGVRATLRITFSTKKTSAEK